MTEMAEPAPLDKVLWVGPAETKLKELIDRLGSWFTLIPVRLDEIARIDKAEAIILDLSQAGPVELKLLKEAEERPLNILTVGLLGLENHLLPQAIAAGLEELIFPPIRPEELRDILTLAARRQRSTRGNGRAKGRPLEVATHLNLPTNLSLIGPVAETLSQDLQLQGRLSSEEVFQLRLTLSEVLTNAMEHGSLEIAFEDKAAAIMKEDYKELVARRSADPRLGRRRVSLYLELSEGQVLYTVADKGSGFDVAEMLKRLSAPDLESPCGRGLFLVNHFMDEFYYNEAGNQITMIKRLTAPTTTPPPAS